ncbi:flavin reductase [Paenibacillus albiflavus]|uniref:Flavin reductase n=1 Tax=Paenibacillus albiflavus TaxID=2545760 RepID=A0A4R4EF95_9BACL|nr:flavin reductase family protein [Paenibacillus albiflavus]TCZ77760.1 flavin reductase [Paenibacillus albiflavus]
MDDQAFRIAMGKFATGVTVITTSIDGEAHGMTANAFMSVSLNPKLVLISIGEKAKMLSKIKESGKFAVSILAEEQKEMSMYFAGQIKEQREIDFEWINDTPVLRSSLATIVCDVYDSLVAGDHTLFVGEVKYLASSDAEPLLFSAGKYRNFEKVGS